MGESGIHVRRNAVRGHISFIDREAMLRDIEIPRTKHGLYDGQVKGRLTQDSQIRQAACGSIADTKGLSYGVF